MKSLCVILLVIAIILSAGNLLYTRDSYKGDYQDRAPPRPKVKLSPKIKKANKG